jgi:hypothetical protein
MMYYLGNKENNQYNVPEMLMILYSNVSFRNNVPEMLKILYNKVSFR